MTIEALLQWLSVLNDGYAKPDLSDRENSPGTVRETKDFKPFIMLINSKLCRMADIECPSVEKFIQTNKPKRV